MFKVEIKKQDVVTNEAIFETEQQAETWVAQEELNKSFGMPAHPELDEEGLVTGVIIPAEYEVVITDITAEVLQKRINEEAEAYLKSTDWYVIRAQEDPSKPIPQQILTLRVAARAGIVR